MRVTFNNSADSQRSSRKIVRHRATRARQTELAFLPGSPEKGPNYTGGGISKILPVVRRRRRPRRRGSSDGGISSGTRVSAARERVLEIYKGRRRTRLLSLGGLYPPAK